MGGDVVPHTVLKAFNYAIVWEKHNILFDGEDIIIRVCVPCFCPYIVLQLTGHAVTCLKKYNAYIYFCLCCLGIQDCLPVVSYQPGDAFGFVCPNPSSEVEWLLQR